MATWARIVDGKVFETTTIDPKGRFHPSLRWEPVPDGTQQGKVFETTPIQFLDAFADAERDAIEDAAAAGDKALRQWLRYATAAQTVELMSSTPGGQRTQAALQYLVDNGLLTSARRDEILSP